MYYVRAIYSQLSDKLGRCSRKLWRNRKDRARLQNFDFTILSQNCIGGIMCHDLGIQFKSPSVNLLFSPKDFIKFVKNIKHYLNQDILFLDSDAPFPIGKVDDIEIKFIHYTSQLEASLLWNERKERINWNNIFVICCDEGLTHEDMIEYDNLPYENKILFVSQPQPDIKCAVVCRRFSDKTDARLLNFANPLGKRFYSNYIDYVAWLNKTPYIVQQ